MECEYPISKALAQQCGLTLNEVETIAGRVITEWWEKEKTKNGY